MERLISWVEIPAENFERAVEFYNVILNLNMKIEKSGENKKAFLPNGEGVIFMTPGFKPSENGVIINLNVGNKLDETIQKIKRKGGTIVKDKTKIEGDSQDFFVLFIDSEGNRIGLNGK